MKPIIKIRMFMRTIWIFNMMIYITETLLKSIREAFCVTERICD